MKKENTVEETTKTMAYDALLDTVACPKCGSRFYKQWQQGDGNGMAVRAKCDDCGFVWDLQRVGRYCG